MNSNQAGLFMEIDREMGKKLLFSAESTPEEKDKGLTILLSTCRKGDPESLYLIGKMLLDGTMILKTGDSKATAVDYLYMAAKKGYYPARAQLAIYCQEKYDRAAPAEKETNQSLTDFDGKRIVIRRTGKMVPVDAVLEFTPEEGNVLTFSLDLTILDKGAEVADPGMLREAVFRGIRMWEGEYTVFGGQQLRVKINISEDQNVFDNVVVVLMAGDMLSMVNKAMSFRHSQKAQHIKDILRDRRSAAAMGLKRWSVRSRKIVFLYSNTNRFDDYYEITHVVKHEFGHILGLGDLYREDDAGLPGVPAGTYSELDCYILKDQFYNLVMCDHHGPISNNDIEMVVLAFCENRLQQYQPTVKNKKVSEALGRGN